jgi:hypothetical protein
MTCAHVLGLIDAGPFADYPQAHREAAWQHARQCATCGPALDGAKRLDADLAVLPQPAPPPDLAVAVIARIARIEETPAVHAGAREWSTWITALGAVAACLAIALWPPSPGQAWIDELTWASVLAAGLALYAAGLFAPLGGNGRHSR